MKIQVIGSGCNKCKKLYELTKIAVEELGVDAEVEYITDITKIIEMNLMTTPVLAIDGVPVAVGQLPDLETVKKFIRGG